MTDLAGTVPDPAIAIALLLTASSVAAYHVLIFYKFFSNGSDPHQEDAQGATNPEDAIFYDPVLAKAFAQDLHHELSTLSTKHATLQIRKNKTVATAKLYEARTVRLAAYLKHTKEKYKSLKKASTGSTDGSKYLLELIDYVDKIRENYNTLLQAYTVLKQAAQQIQEENATVREALLSSTHHSTSTTPSSLEEVKNRLITRLRTENEAFISQIQTLEAEKKEWEEEQTALREAMDSMLHDSTLSHVDDEAYDADESWLSDDQSGSTSHDGNLASELQDAIGNGWTSEDGLGDTY